MERLIEPAVLLLLRERPRHGYDLLEDIPDLVGEGADVDLGNLYRLLRGLEAEGVVSSQLARRLSWSGPPDLHVDPCRGPIARCVGDGTAFHRVRRHHVPRSL